MLTFVLCVAGGATGVFTIIAISVVAFGATASAFDD